MLLGELDAGIGKIQDGINGKRGVPKSRDAKVCGGIGMFLPASMPFARIEKGSLLPITGFVSRRENNRRCLRRG
jgi:hypothetical protein